MPWWLRTTVDALNCALLTTHELKTVENHTVCSKFPSKLKKNIFDTLLTYQEFPVLLNKPFFKSLYKRPSYPNLLIHVASY